MCVCVCVCACVKWWIRRVKIGDPENNLLNKCAKFEDSAWIEKKF